MVRSVFAIVDDQRTCLAALRAAGFQESEISFLAAGSTAEPGMEAADGTESPADASLARPAADVGWLPAVGAILACGPLALLLRGGAGLVKPLAELGVPSYAAVRYEQALGHGGTVIAVHTENGFEVETVAELLRDGGGVQVAAA